MHVTANHCEPPHGSCSVDIACHGTTQDSTSIERAYHGSHNAKASSSFSTVPQTEIIYAPSHSLCMKESNVSDCCTAGGSTANISMEFTAKTDSLTLNHPHFEHHTESTMSAMTDRAYSNDVSKWTSEETITLCTEFKETFEGSVICANSNKFYYNRGCEHEDLPAETERDKMLQQKSICDIIIDTAYQLDSCCSICKCVKYDKLIISSLKERSKFLLDWDSENSEKSENNPDRSLPAPHKPKRDPITITEVTSKTSTLEAHLEPTNELPISTIQRAKDITGGVQVPAASSTAESAICTPPVSPSKHRGSPSTPGSPVPCSPSTKQAASDLSSLLDIGAVDFEEASSPVALTLIQRHMEKTFSPAAQSPETTRSQEKSLTNKGARKPRPPLVSFTVPASVSSAPTSTGPACATQLSIAEDGRLAKRINKFRTDGDIRRATRAEAKETGAAPRNSDPKDSVILASTVCAEERGEGKRASLHANSEENSIPKLKCSMPFIRPVPVTTQIPHRTFSEELINEYRDMTHDQLHALQIPDSLKPHGEPWGQDATMREERGKWRVMIYDLIQLRIQKGDMLTPREPKWKDGTRKQAQGDKTNAALRQVVYNESTPVTDLRQMLRGPVDIHNAQQSFSDPNCNTMHQQLIQPHDDLRLRLQNKRPAHPDPNLNMNLLYTGKNSQGKKRMAADMSLSMRAELTQESLSSSRKMRDIDYEIAKLMRDKRALEDTGLIRTTAMQATTPAPNIDQPPIDGGYSKSVSLLLDLVDIDDPPTVENAQVNSESTQAVYTGMVQVNGTWILKPASRTMARLTTDWRRQHKAAAFAQHTQSKLEAKTRGARTKGTDINGKLLHPIVGNAEVVSENAERQLQLELEFKLASEDNIVAAKKKLATASAALTDLTKPESSSNLSNHAHMKVLIRERECQGWAP